MDRNTQLSSLQPKFTHNNATYLKCRHLHQLLVNEEDEEVLRRAQELTPSLLSHSCQYKRGTHSVTEVIIPSYVFLIQTHSLHPRDRSFLGKFRYFFPKSKLCFPGDCSAPGCPVQFFPSGGGSSASRS